MEEETKKENDSEPTSRTGDIREIVPKEKVIFGPIPYEIKRSTASDIQDDLEHIKKTWPGFEIIKAFDDCDAVKAIVLRGLAVVPLEMPCVPDVTFWVIKSRRSDNDHSQKEGQIPDDIVGFFSAAGAQVYPDDGDDVVPQLVCYNRAFGSIEVIRKIYWQETLLAMLFCAVSEKLANDGETV